jgi:hypothetical protein
MSFPSALNQRIDLVLLRGAIGVDEVNLIGDRPDDRTPSGLWPADHAGLVAKLEIPTGSLPVPEASTWVMLLLDFAGACLGAPIRHRRGSPPSAVDGQPAF